MPEVHSTKPEPVSEPPKPSTPEPAPNSGSENKNVAAKTAPILSSVPSVYPSPKPKTTRGEIIKYILSVGILGLGVASFVVLYSMKVPPKEQDSKELVQMVSTFEAMPFSGQLDKVISGTVVPFREIRVAAEVSGNISKKYEAFEAGNFVKKGTKLLEIDPTDYQLQLRTKEAEVEQSQKMLEETQEEIAGAERNIKLSENEYQLVLDEYNRNMRIKNALSSTELDQSKRALLTAESALTTRKNSMDTLRARVKRMEAALALTKAQLNRTQLSLEKTVIVAPDDGVIVREMVQKGDYVRAGDQLVTFEDTSKSEVICNLTTSDLAWVRDNSPASAEFGTETDDGNANSFSVYYLPKTKVSVFDSKEPENTWQGILSRFDGIGRDQSTRTIPCRITVENPVIETENGKRALVRGMYVKCKIQVQTSAEGNKRGFLSFPSVALRPGNYVWIVRDKKLKRLSVEVVDSSERLIGKEIEKIVVVTEKEGSLQRGDMIVTTPLTQPTDGVEVMLDNESADVPVSVETTAAE
ncbi:MAG: efflux RND transporter periplasmic adaptor subunit [Mariniblastus sp.]